MARPIRFEATLLGTHTVMLDRKEWERLLRFLKAVKIDVEIKEHRHAR